MLGVTAAPSGFPLQVLIPLRSIAGFPLQSLTQSRKLKEHSSSKTTEIYTHVSTKNLQNMV